MTATSGVTGEEVSGEDGVARLAAAIADAEALVAFTGAGISTESGHPRLPLARRHLEPL